jgi:hypothetical protein
VGRIAAEGRSRADDDPTPATPFPAALPDEVLALPRLNLPGRDYLLFRGPLEAVRQMGHQITDSWLDPQSPSLLWPADRSWCLATEIDVDSTLVAALLAEPRLEAWQVEPGDDLTEAGDVVNG